MDKNELEKLKVEFYVQILSAEVCIEEDDLGSVEEALQGSNLKRFWNTIGCMNSDGFVQQLTLRAVRCLVKSYSIQDPGNRELLLTICGGLLMGPTTLEIAHGVISLLISASGDTLQESMNLLQLVLEKSLSPHTNCITEDVAKTTTVNKPMLPHFVCRILLVFERLLLKIIFHEEAIDDLLKWKIQNSAVADVISCAWVPCKTYEAEAMKVWAIRVVTAICIASPKYCLDLTQLLVTAMYVEEPRVATPATQSLWDLTFIHPQLGVSVGEEDTTTNTGSLSTLLQSLESPVIDIQRLSCHGLCRLLLFGSTLSPEFLIGKLVLKSSEQPQDPITVDIVNSFLTMYTKQGQNGLIIANSIVQICVELYSTKVISETEVALGFIVPHLPPEFLDPTVSGIIKNLTDFFGSSPEDTIIRSWLSNHSKNYK